MTDTPVYPQTITASGVQILTATASGFVTLYTAGANGSKVENVIVTNTDASNAYTLQLTVNAGGTNFLIGTVNIPLSSGNTTAAPSVTLLNNIQIPGLCRDGNMNSYIYLATGTILKANILGGQTVSSGKALNIYVQGGDF